MKQNTETFLGCNTSYEYADIVLYGAPFDSTASFRPGARFGSSAIRHESIGLETYSPYQGKDLEDCSVFDYGDLELGFGNTEAALSDIEKMAKKISGDGKIPLMLGGEHLVTLGSVKALYDRYPKLHIIQFDAHADLRKEYMGVRLSHACVMRRCYELVGEKKLHQFCVRSGTKEEFAFARSHTDFYPFGFSWLGPAVRQLMQKNTPVYLSIDLDCLDSAVLPGTGTPEAGGVTFMELLEAIRTVCQANVVGADVTELAPMLDASGMSTATACKVVRELILALSD